MTLSRFVKVYNSLPIAERDLACCVIDDEAISWKLAYHELKENTEFSKKIQAKLESLGLI